MPDLNLGNPAVEQELGRASGDAAALARARLDRVQHEKIERYQQTLKREWALGQRYRSSGHRALALPHWLEHYNTRRRHSGIGNRPPISRVRNV